MADNILSHIRAFAHGIKRMQVVGGVAGPALVIQYDSYENAQLGMDDLETAIKIARGEPIEDDSEELSD